MLANLVTDGAPNSVCANDNRSIVAGAVCELHSYLIFLRNNVIKLLLGEDMILGVFKTAKKRIGKTTAICNNNRVSMTDDEVISQKKLTKMR